MTSSASGARRTPAGRKDGLFGVAEQPQGPLGRTGRPARPGDHGPRKAEEKAFREAVAKDPQAARIVRRRLGDRRQIACRLEGDLRRLGPARARPGFHSELFGIARTLVRLADETAKPNAERLREYRESNLDSLKQGLFSEAPIYDDLETVELADSLGLLVETLGAENRWVQTGAGRQVAPASGPPN